MKYLNIKLRRDIGRNWTQFFSVFLMAFLSVLIFVGLQGAWRGLEVSLNRFVNSSSLADHWIQSTEVTKEDQKLFEQISDVKKVAVKTRIKVNVANATKKDQYLILDTFEQAITKPFVVTGKSVQKSNTDGIWINKEYARENQIKTGDLVSVRVNKQLVKLKVLGIIQSADQIYFTGTADFIAPNYKNYGYGLISKHTLKEKLHYVGAPNLLEIKGKSQKVRTEAEMILGKRFVSYADSQTLTAVADAFDRVGQIRNLSFLFSFIFIILAVLAMYTTIKRLIETQIQEIAILKALGYSNRKIGLHYSSFGLLVGGGGALLGIVISPIMSTFVLSTQKAMFSLPKWTIAYTWSAALVFLLVVIICVGTALLAARSAINGLPSLFLRGDNQKTGRTVLIERFHRLWQKLRYEHRWAIRDASINYVRLLMGIIGVAGGMMLLTAGFGMPESINHLVDKAYGKDFTYDKRLEINNSETSQDIKGQKMQVMAARFTPDDDHNRYLYIVGAGNYVHLKTETGQQLKEDGIYVTKGFAERAHLKVGQQLNVRPALTDQSYRFKIKGILTNETSQGAYLKQTVWEEVAGKWHPQFLLAGKTPSLHQISKEPNVESVVKIADQKQNAYDFVNSLMSIFLMIIGFAVLLVVVVLYNLGSLNFVERMRDYATLRVLGFHKKELRNITMIENVVTTFIGWLIGIPLGMWFLDQYVRTFSTIKIEYTSYYSWRNLLFSSIVVWLCSLTTTFFISKRIQKLDMVAALKSVE